MGEGRASAGILSVYGNYYIIHFFQHFNRCIIVALIDACICKKPLKFTQQMGFDVCMTFTCMTVIFNNNVQEDNFCMETYKRVLHVLWSSQIKHNCIHCPNLYLCHFWLASDVMQVCVMIKWQKPNTEIGWAAVIAISFSLYVTQQHHTDEPVFACEVLSIILSSNFAVGRM